MNFEQFKHFIHRILATQEGELDCGRVQALLPAYVDAEIYGRALETPAQIIRAHLFQCPDCSETYAGLRLVAQLEAEGGLPEAEESLQPLAAPAGAGASDYRPEPV